MAAFISTPAAVSFDQDERESFWQRRPSILGGSDERRKGVSSRPRVSEFYRYGRRAYSEPGASAVKRMADVAGAGLALAVLAPLFVALALAIKWESRGPVLFTQRRYGRRGRLFRVYKFRTMYTDMADRSGVCQTVEGDPRITRIGRILRLTSFDELPQLFNVLKGEMSLVGPRPHVPGMLAGGYLYEDLVPYYFQRYTVRPGLTGLAQSNGYRGSTTDPAAAITRVDYDLDYIENWSLWLDCKIVLRTIRREFISGSGI